MILALMQFQMYYFIFTSLMWNHDEHTFKKNNGFRAKFKKIIVLEQNFA